MSLDLRYFSRNSNRYDHNNVIFERVVAETQKWDTQLPRKYFYEIPTKFLRSHAHKVYARFILFMNRILVTEIKKMRDWVFSFIL